MADGNIKSRAKARLTAPILEDFAWIARRMRPDEIEQHVASYGDEEYSPDAAALRFATYPGPKWTLLGEDGMPVAVCGYIPVRPGVYAAWAAGTMDRWKTHWRTMTKLSRRTMATLLERPDVHRVEILALDSRTEAHRWYVDGLDMTDEGVQRGAFNGLDARMFARIKA